MNEIICNCRSNFRYPHNDLRTTTAYKKLLENIGNIPIEKIEELTKDL